MSTITCNEEMKVNIKCKNSHFEPPFGYLWVTHRVHLRLDGKRVVDFLLAIIELFSLALPAAAPLSEICQNQRFLKGVGHFEHKFYIDGDIARNPLDRGMMQLQLCRWKFSHKETLQRTFFDRS